MPPKNCKSFVLKSFENWGRLGLPMVAPRSLRTWFAKPIRCVFHQALA